jgi:SAM-dependent methyltransferase
MDRNDKVIEGLHGLRPATLLNVGEVGCGRGASCRLWAARGHQVYGVDHDPARIAAARTQAGTVLFDIAAASALPWPARSMDLCLVHGAVARGRDWAQCLAELLRVLKPGGVLYLVDGLWNAGLLHSARATLGGPRGSPLAFKRVSGR